VSLVVPLYIYLVATMLRYAGDAAAAEDDAGAQADEEEYETASEDEEDVKATN